MFTAQARRRLPKRADNVRAELGELTLPVLLPKQRSPPRLRSSSGSALATPICLSRGAEGELSTRGHPRGSTRSPRGDLVEKRFGGTVEARPRVAVGCACCQEVQELLQLSGKGGRCF